MTLPRFIFSLVILLLASLQLQAGLRVGFSEVDITPRLDGPRPVFIAGYGQNRRATGVHDKLWSRVTVLDDGHKKIALVSVDLVGLQYPAVLEIRKRLPEFDYLLVSSTHNHEGPDVVGLWGPTYIISGFDRAYYELLLDKIVESVRRAAAKTTRVVARYGTAQDDSLVNDSRQPIVKDGVLRLISFHRRGRGRPVGMIVQWNCHPESMGSRNTLLTADFTTPVVEHLRKEHGCPVLYVSGAVGGLMAPPRDRIHDSDGTLLKQGDFRYTEAYGYEVGRLATRAYQAAESIKLTPLGVSAKRISLPVTNAMYKAARIAGVLARPAYEWTGDPEKRGTPRPPQQLTGQMSVETEVACLRLGELPIVCVPGEIYPELVYGIYQDPADPNADFPDAPLEPGLTTLLGQEKWMMFGLANDEIGYIIPRRQWDRLPPFAYGRNSSQYGEINSCGPDTAPILMRMLRQVIETSQITRRPKDG
jgi:hypothetical protein